MSDKYSPWPSGKFGCPDGRPSDLVEQFEPGYAFRETGLWNGMTPEQVKVWQADLDKSIKQRAILYHFEPFSPPN